MQFPRCTLHRNARLRRAALANRSAPAKPGLITPPLNLNGTAVQPTELAGPTPGSVGLYRINFQVPAHTPDGDLTLVVSQGVTPMAPFCHEALTKRLDGCCSCWHGHVAAASRERGNSRVWPAKH